MGKILDIVLRALVILSKKIKYFDLKKKKKFSSLTLKIKKIIVDLAFFFIEEFLFDEKMT